MKSNLSAHQFSKLLAAYCQLVDFLPHPLRTRVTLLAVAAAQKETVSSWRRLTPAEKRLPALLAQVLQIHRCGGAQKQPAAVADLLLHYLLSFGAAAWGTGVLAGGD